MQSWTIDPILNPWFLATAGGALAALLILRPQFGLLTSFRRWTLIGLRAGIVLLAILLMLRPGCVTTIEQPQNALLVMLLDVSRSMELPVGSDQTTRWQKMSQVLSENADKLAALEKQRIELKIYGFDGRLSAIGIEQGSVLLPKEPVGVESDYGSNLDDATRAARNQRLIAVILHGDGRTNVLDPRVELAQAASQLDQSQIPLYTVPYGRPADSGQFADIAVTNMPDNYTGFVKNRQTFTATVSARGFSNRTIPVQLIVTDPGGAKRVVDSKKITFTGPDQKANVSLGFEPEKAGQYRVQVKAEPQSEEISPRNNQLPAFLTVFDGGLKVLYVTGNVGAEQRFIRQAIGSSAEIKIDPIIIPARDRSNWDDAPRDFSDKFSDPSYDVIVLADIDAKALHQKGVFEKNFKAIEKAVLNGKGLLMTGGYHSFGPGSYALTPLEDLLPVLMEPTERQDFDGPLRKELHIEKPITLRPVGQHFLNSISGDDTKNVWKKLPPLSGANRFLKIKDSAQVLLRGDDEPMLISTQVGGRVLAFAGDSTWRWWLGGFQNEHKRFWRQVILWLAFRDSLTNSNVWINLPQRRFQPRSDVQFTIGSKSPTGIPIEGASYSVQIENPDGEKRSLSATVADEGQRKVQVDRESVAKPGLYRISVQAKKNGAEIGRATAEFIVFDQDREKSIAAADPDQLLRLSNQTREWGGKMILPDEFGVLLDEILSHPPEMKIEIPQKWRLGDSWQDGTIVLVLFVLLLGCEWACRKKWGMV